jgi:hypothetical protein
LKSGHTLEIGRFGVGDPQLVEQPNLTAFGGKIEAHIEIGKYVLAIGGSHAVERLRTSLRQNDGVRFPNGGQIAFIGIAAGTDNIFIRHDDWVERKNHNEIRFNRLGRFAGLASLAGKTLLER